MRRGSLAALALLVAVASGGGHAALAQDDGPRENQTTARMWTEGGYRGTWTAGVTRLSDSTVRVRAGGILQQPSALNGVVRIRCLTQEGDYVCFDQAPLALRAGTRTERRCTTRILRQRQRRRRVRRCRNVTVPIESSVTATVNAVGADGAPARIYEVLVYYVTDDGTIVSTSGRLPVRR